jgi:integrase
MGERGRPRCGRTRMTWRALLDRRQGSGGGHVAGRVVVRQRPAAAASGRGERRAYLRCGAGLSAVPIKRRLAAVSSLYGFLVARGEVAANPVPQGLPTRKSRHRDRGAVPLVRGVRRLPRILEPAEVEALMAALRTERDRAIVRAMLLGGLRRCEVRGLRLEDLRLGEWRVFIAEGKGGHQRLVPVSQTFCHRRSRPQRRATGRRLCHAPPGAVEPRETCRPRWSSARGPSGR